MKDWEKQFKPDAKIWELYLKDAEEEAKENAEVWKNGLDSLLIFAGLFAGVVSSFVTSVGSSSSDSPQELPRDLWIKGLWATSLLVTLFSAVMGVLAKAWSVKFIPVSSKREAKDAYQRRILDKRAKRWQLERVIKFIPLLIQIAAFLFAAGFAVQSRIPGCHRDSCLLPIISFRNPSIRPVYICKGTILGSSDDEEDIDAWSERDIEGELADIWLNKLIKSPKVLQVDEAIAELTRQWPTFQLKWQKHFGSSAAPNIIVRRLREYMVLGFHNKSEEYEELCHHFLSLLQLTHYYESLEGHDKSSPLCRALTDTLKPFGPLHRWNVFPEAVRPLAFILRTHLMIFAGRGDLDIHNHANSPFTDVTLIEAEDRPWENMVHNVQSRHRLNFLIAACRGLAEGARNSQTVSSFILSMSIAKVAVVGPTIEWSGDVSSGQRSKAEAVAKKYIVKLFATIARKWEDMITVEVPNLPNLNVYQELQKEFSVPEAMNVVDNIISLLSHSDNVTRMHAIAVIKAFTDKSILSQDALKHLIPKLAELTLNDEDNDVRTGAIELFVWLQRPNKINEIMTACISTVVKYGLENSAETQLRTLKALIRMKREFSNRRGFDTSSVSSSNSAETGKDDPGLFETFIAGSITELTRVAMSETDDNSEVRNAGRKLLKHLSIYKQYRNEITDTMRELLTSILSDAWLKWSACRKSLNTALEILEECRRKLWFNIFIIDRIFDTTWFSRRSGISSLAEKWLANLVEAKFIQSDNVSSDVDYDKCVEELGHILRQDEWHNTITEFEERLKLELKSEYWQCRFAAVRFCQKAPLIPELIRMGFLDDDPDVRSESLKVLKFLIQNNDLDVLESMKTCLMHHFDKIFGDDLSSSPQIEWIEIVGLLAEATDFREGVYKLMDTAVNSLFPDHREMARNSLLLISLSNPQTIKREMIMRLNRSESLEASINESQGKPAPEQALHWLELLVLLRNHPTAREIIPTLTSMAMKCKERLQDHQLYHNQLALNAEDEDGEEDSNRDIQIKPLIQALGYLAECSSKKRYQIILVDYELTVNTPEDLPDVILALVKIARESKSEDVQSTAIRVLAPLALKGDIQFALPRLLEFAVNEKNKYTGQTCHEAVAKLTSLASTKDNNKFLEALKKLVSNVTVPLDSHLRVRMKWLELCTLLAKKKLQKWTHMIASLARRDEDEDVRREAVRSLTILIMSEEFQIFLTTLIKMATVDRDEDVRLTAVNSLISLLEDEKIHESSLEIITSKHLESGLADTSWDVCLAWVKLTELLQSNQELSVISKLVDTSVSHDDRNVQKSAMDMALKLSIHDNKLSPSIAFDTSKRIESALKNQEHAIRIRAVKAVKIVAGIDNVDFSDDVISKVVPYLLTIAIGEEGQQQSEAQDTLEHIKKNATVFSEVPSSLTNITTVGRNFVIPYFKTLKNTDNNSTCSAARNLASVLKSGSWNTRGTAIELLAHIYSEYGTEYFPQLIYDTISDLISVALDEKKVNNEVRIHALDLIPADKCFDEIKRSLPQFILLLEHERLRLPAVRLISLLAQDNIVRKAILSQTISLSTSNETQSFKGYITLLSRLLLDKRLKDEPTDYAMILLACSLVTQPRLVHLRFQVVSALWCYYSKDERELNEKIPAELVKWFTFALFGRHANKTEVDRLGRIALTLLKDIRRNTRYSNKLESGSECAEFVNERSKDVLTSDSVL
ncbi:armadillo-type protein [Cyathus striatus]|nr:armadillo-type protein [Cyathus striatus]